MAYLPRSKELKHFSSARAATLQSFVPFELEEALCHQIPGSPRLALAYSKTLLVSHLRPSAYLVYWLFLKILDFWPTFRFE